jgi:hypothetical protein
LWGAKPVSLAAVVHLCRKDPGTRPFLEPLETLESRRGARVVGVLARRDAWGRRCLGRRGVVSPRRRQSGEFGQSRWRLRGQKGWVGRVRLPLSGGQRRGRDRQERPTKDAEKATNGTTLGGDPLGFACQLLGWNFRCRSQGSPNWNRFELSLETLSLIQPYHVDIGFTTIWRSAPRPPRLLPPRLVLC